MRNGIPDSDARFCTATAGNGGSCELQVRNAQPEDRSTLKPMNKGPWLKTRLSATAIGHHLGLHSRFAYGCKCSSQLGPDPCRLRKGCRDSGVACPRVEQALNLQ